MNSDFEELLKAFNDEAVKYLVVGGYGVMLYTKPRYTKDLDVWVEASAGNAEKVFRALAQFGAPLEGLSAVDQEQARTGTAQRSARRGVAGVAAKRCAGQVGRFVRTIDSVPRRPSVRRQPLCPTTIEIHSIESLVECR